MSRTKTIGKKGVSVGADFNKHLQYIVLNKNPVDFTKMNMTYLKKASGWIATCNIECWLVAGSV